MTEGMKDLNMDPAAETLEKTAQNVLKYYDAAPEGITLIQGDSIKTVWKVRTAAGALCLKRLKQTVDKARFSVNAQIYIRNSGGKVPGVMPGRDGSPIAEHNGQLFVLYEWLDGRDLNFENRDDLKTAIQGLAAFHKASRGYVPEAGCRVSTKLGKWPEQYRSMLNRMSSWKSEAESRASRPDYSAYLKYADLMLEIGGLALEALGTSRYGVLTAEGSPFVVLCHQDFGKGNVLACSDGVFVLDLDGVTFDLPARDLRKLIGKNAEAANRWDESAMGGILEWYEAVFPLDSEVRQALYADLLFPHWFFGLVKNLFQAGKQLKPSGVERIARLEESKVELLRRLLNRSE